MLNTISVDVEDYFHPSEVQAFVDSSAWEDLPPRVEDATRRVLDLFARHNARGTFFILGWVARRHPALLRDIAAAGHEIACHSYAHRLVYELTPVEFREDTQLAQQVIADACGLLPRAYRAPSYSVTERSLWALEILAELGFTHDSSIYPIRHDRYGIPGFGLHARLVSTPSGPIMEVPAATVRLPSGRLCPVGGGAYLRLLPYRYTAAGIRRVNDDEKRSACLYFHPWELDAGQPRLARGLLARVRTYSGLRRMEAKLDRLFADFAFAPLTTVFPAAATAANSPAALA